MAVAAKTSIKPKSPHNKTPTLATVRVKTGDVSLDNNCAQCCAVTERSLVTVVLIPSCREREREIQHTELLLNSYCVATDLDTAQLTAAFIPPAIMYSQTCSVPAILMECASKCY